MGALGVLIRILQYAGLYVQLNAALNVGHGEVDNHISGNGVVIDGYREKGGFAADGFALCDALFTEVPHDITTQSGEDVEMACSFRGAGSPSYSLEIQWWYVKEHRDWKADPAPLTNNVIALEETSKDATKISVVKVAGSNISHKLRLSSVKPSDEGTYECRVINFSGTAAQQHRVRAYLQVQPQRTREAAPRRREAGAEELKTSSGSSTDCNQSCVL